jgi:hypothetical protein
VTSAGLVARGLLAALAALLLARPACSEDPVELRREYNHVAASIDTLVRLHGGAALDALTARPQAGSGIVPQGFELVLIFWADDEAEVHLNGFHIGSTRLTPTQIEIPSLYLSETNQVRAHCWDTDRVESGFMAGFYLRDAAGLRPVLVTEEGKWWAAGQQAQEIYYTHSQPDIPGARVIWGERLFGETVIEAQFSGSSVVRAARRRPLKPPDIASPEQRMEAHDVVTRLVGLQTRREALAAALAGWSHDPPKVRYRGYVSGQLAFSLGRAGPLAEQLSVSTAERLQQWAEALPAEQRRLVFQEPRELKGVRVATEAQARAGGAAEDADRRADYQAPPERGPVQEGVAVWRRAQRPRPQRGAGSGLRWGLTTAALGLVAYLTAVGRQWWRIFSGEVWRA